MPILHASKASYSPPEYNVIKDINVDTNIVLVTATSDFVFNDDLLKVKDWVMADLCEYTWQHKLTETHQFGVNTDKFRWRFDSPEWDKFDNWVKNNPPRLYLKRELLKKDVSDFLVSITYPCYYPAYPIQTKDEFDARPIELFFSFGRSHEDRIMFHSNAYKEPGVDVVDSIYHLQGYLEEGGHEHLWCSFHIPHFARLDIQHLFNISALSKLSLSIPGAGIRCFRDSEAPVNSIMVLQDNDVCFPFDWVHGINCIRYKGSDPIPAIKEALRRDDLYDIYLRGMENIEKYRMPNFYNYFKKLIKSVS